MLHHFGSHWKHVISKEFLHARCYVNSISHFPIQTNLQHYADQPRNGEETEAEKRRHRKKKNELQKKWLHIPQPNQRDTTEYSNAFGSHGILMNAYSLIDVEAIQTPTTNFNIIESN